MTSTEFIHWLRGFTEGVHEFNITPKQWDLLKERLAEVNDNGFVETPGMFQVHPEPSYPGVPVGTGRGFPNTAPISPLPYYPNPLDNPFRVTCNLTGSGTVSTPGFATTTTPNYITTHNPITVRTSGYLSASFISPVTSTATNFPPGTTVTYTTSGGPTWYSINKIENDSGNK